MMSAGNTMPRRAIDAPPPEKTHSVTIRLPSSLRERAYAVAQREYRTLSSLALQALAQYIDEKERELQIKDNRQ
jgi:hypothetical protein